MLQPAVVPAGIIGHVATRGADRRQHPGAGVFDDGTQRRAVVVRIPGSWIGAEQDHPAGADPAFRGKFEAFRGTGGDRSEGRGGTRRVSFARTEEGAHPGEHGAVAQDAAPGT